MSGHTDGTLSRRSTGLPASSEYARCRFPTNRSVSAHPLYGFSRFFWAA